MPTISVQSFLTDLKYNSLRYTFLADPIEQATAEGELIFFRWS